MYSEANLLTFDVEEYFQVSNFEDIVSRAEWESLDSRLNVGLDKIERLLDKKQVKATFFVLGWVARRHQEAIKRLHSAGHEIACHGYAHQLVYDLTPDEFRQDLRLAKNILEDITQEAVIGYRAPSFSITNSSIWAFDILSQEGFVYDSSIFPIYHDRGGLPGADRFIHAILSGKSELVEIPLSTVMFFKYNIPIAGGGYLRLFPYWFIKQGLISINKNHQPFVVYIHPWEFDNLQPRMALKGLRRFRHYINLAQTERKAQSLIEDFSFQPIRDFLKHSRKAVGDEQARH